MVIIYLTSKIERFFARRRIVGLRRAVGFDTQSIGDLTRNQLLAASSPPKDPNRSLEEELTALEASL